MPTTLLRPLLALAASIPALAEPPPPVQDAVDQQRLMQTLRDLPIPRSAKGEMAEQMGLMKTEDVLLRALQDLGYEPELFKLWWNAEREQRTRDYLQAKAEGRAEGMEPPPQRGEPGSEPDGLVWHNVIAELPGRDLPREILIVGAHFDTVPAAGGADDNGTGVAALLELARVLKDRPMRRTVRFIFFNLEESGLHGSAEYAAMLRKRLAAKPPPGQDPERVVGMISLEMLGYFSDEEGSQKSPVPPIEGVFAPPTVGDFIGLVTVSTHREFARELDAAMRRSAPELKTLVADFFPPPPLTPANALRSDHAPFLALGIPAVMVTDTANFRNPHYHKPTDTVETIDAERFTAVVRALAGAVHALAEPAPPEPDDDANAAPDGEPAPDKNTPGRRPGEDGRGPGT